MQKTIKQKQQNKSNEEHSSAIVKSLTDKLTGFSNGLKNVLEKRSQSLKEQKDRREKFGGSSIESLCNFYLNIILLILKCSSQHSESCACYHPKKYTTNTKSTISQH